MWFLDKYGTELQSRKDAFIELRTRAQHAIAEGDLLGIDMRQRRTRLTDESGKVLFEGSLEDAARLEINGRIYLPDMI